MKACDCYVPLKTVNNQKKSPWANQGVCALFKFRKSKLWFYNQRTKLKCLSLIKKYKETLDILKKQSKAAIRNY